MQALLHFEDVEIYARNPSSYLEVKSGKLFRDNVVIGDALELSKALELAPSKNFFPAWVGFIGYEYARHFGLVTHEPDGNFPEAAFMLFDGPSQRGAEPFPDFAEAKSPSPTIGRGEFMRSVTLIQEEIRAGDVYQVNLTRQFEVSQRSIDPFTFYNYLKTNNPSPFMGILQGPDWSIVSGSPERLFRLQNGTISTQPIAGTKPNIPGAREQLLSNPKELAEHAMLVDLMRNDLARICKTGSVKVPKPFDIEAYRHVLHLVSTVTGETDAPLGDIMCAIFPGGTITGAPKESAMQSIARHELIPRGPYTGSFGYVSSGHGVDFNILIRSLFIGRNKTYFSAGAGIVIGSDPQSELEETEHKVAQFRNFA
ncbi:MAG: anthranilate synthase component I family protein [Myxococcota bacterium]